MIGFLFGKVLWVGRAATFCMGLAVVLAVVLGVGTTALAAVPGDPFKLGRLNTVDRVTSLVGSVSGPLFRADNNGGGPALALEANVGRPPLTVNAGAGKATNLDADRLDGKDASAFLPADGKAQSAARADQAGDAGTLDGKDSTDFYVAGSKAQDAAHADTADDAGTLDGKDSTDFYTADSKVTDADKLDGLDSGQFMRDFSRRIGATSATDSSPRKTVNAQCPSGERPVDGYAEIRPNPASVAPIPVALQAEGTIGSNLWRVSAAEMLPHDGEWSLWVVVTCVTAPPEISADDGTYSLETP